MSAAVIGTLKENPIDGAGKLKVMAKQVRPWLTQPSGSMGLIHKSVQVIRRQPAHPIRAGDSKSRTKAEYMAAILNLRTKTKRVLDKPGRPYMDLSAHPLTRLTTRFPIGGWCSAMARSDWATSSRPRSSRHGQAGHRRRRLVRL